MKVSLLLSKSMDINVTKMLGAGHCNNLFEPKQVLSHADCCTALYLGTAFFKDATFEIIGSFSPVAIGCTRGKDHRHVFLAG